MYFCFIYSIILLPPPLAFFGGRSEEQFHIYTSASYTCILSFPSALFPCLLPPSQLFSPPTSLPPPPTYLPSPSLPPSLLLPPLPPPSSFTSPVLLHLPPPSPPSLPLQLRSNLYSGCRLHRRRSLAVLLDWNTSPRLTNCSCTSRLSYSKVCCTHCMGRAWSPCLFPLTSSL